MTVLARRKPKTILITGASGVVGTALIPELAHHRLITLRHRNAPMEGTRQVRGDLTQPALGLDLDVYDNLADQVDVVIHAAAITDFTAGSGKTNDLNIEGTKRVIEFARDAGAVLHYVSTAFVGRADLTRDEVGEAAADPSHYLVSKRHAEQLVRDSGLQYTISRPSVVIGNSGSGEIAAFQGLHTLVGAVLRNQLPLIPLNPVDRVDFIPADFVAGALAGLVERDVRKGEFWLTSGAAALSAQEMLDITVATAAELGVEVAAPRMVPVDMIDRLIRPVFIDPLPDRDRRKFDDLMAMTALFGGAEEFPSSFGRMPGTKPLTTEGMAAAFVASAVYLARTKNLIQSANNEAAA